MRWRWKIAHDEPWRTLNEWAAAIGMIVAGVGLLVVVAAVVTAAVIVAVRQ